MKQLVACCLALVAISVFSSSAAAEINAKAYERVLQQLSKAVESSEALSNQVAAYDVVFQRDPLQPLIDSQGQVVAPVGLRSGLAVQGIIWSPERPLAVVDGELLGVGQVAGPYIIQEIRGDGILVKRGTQLIFIPLDRGLEPPSATPRSSQ